MAAGRDMVSYGSREKKEACILVKTFILCLYDNFSYQPQELPLS